METFAVIAGVKVTPLFIASTKRITTIRVIDFKKLDSFFYSWFLNAILFHSASLSSPKLAVRVESITLWESVLSHQILLTTFMMRNLPLGNDSSGPEVGNCTLNSNSTIPLARVSAVWRA